MNEKDYHKMLGELYKENQKFLNKAILAISLLAIPFLFKGGLEDGISLCAKYIFTASLLGFFVVILLQILSLKYARDGCDDGLSEKEETQKRSKGLFDKARKLDIWREGVFLFSLFLIIPAFLINIITMEKNMSDNKETPKEAVKMVETPNENDGKFSFTPPQSVEESFTPPKSLEKSFTPPKSTVPDSAPSTSDGNSSTPQPSQNNEGK